MINDELQLPGEYEVSDVEKINNPPSKNGIHKNTLFVFLKILLNQIQN